VNLVGAGGIAVYSTSMKAEPTDPAHELEVEFCVV